jgi:Glycosyl hydrolases family 2, TIM barrel domain
VNESPFLIKGIHYGPWRPGTGPGKDYPYPPLEQIAQDFEIIRRTNANTLLIYDPPAEVLDLAERYELKVIYMFALDWDALGGPDQSVITTRVTERAAELRAKPALLAWLLGNEIGEGHLQSRGEGPILAGLRALYTALKAADPAHPVSHANWPPTRHLDLRFLDFISFNLYPLWPNEVVALGFGSYVEHVLRPIAADKALLISEFGANTIEVAEGGQAQLLRQSWDGLVRAGAAGGVVFEFADEWWKNYNNPVRPGDWWTRVAARDDEVRHDQDPEETYGIMRADRTPKPAFNEVADMFSVRRAGDTARMFGALTLSALVLVAATAWLWARRHSRRLDTVGRTGTQHPQ